MRLLAIICFLLLIACSGPTTSGSGNSARQAVDGEILLNGYVEKGYTGTLLTARFVKLTDRSQVSRFRRVVSGTRAGGIQCNTRTVNKSSTSAAAPSYLSVGKMAIGNGSDTRYIEPGKDNRYSREFTEFLMPGIYDVAWEGSAQTYGGAAKLLLPVALEEVKSSDHPFVSDEAIIVQKSVGMILGWKQAKVSPELDSFIFLDIITDNGTQQQLMECSIPEEEIVPVNGRHSWTVAAEKFKDLFATTKALVSLTRLQGVPVKGDKVGIVTFIGAQTVGGRAAVAE